MREEDSRRLASDDRQFRRVREMGADGIDGAVEDRGIEKQIETEAAGLTEALHGDEGFLDFGFGPVRAFRKSPRTTAARSRLRAQQFGDAAMQFLLGGREDDAALGRVIAGAVLNDAAVGDETRQQMIKERIRQVRGGIGLQIGAAEAGGAGRLAMQRG